MSTRSTLVRLNIGTLSCLTFTSLRIINPCSDVIWIYLNPHMLFLNLVFATRREVWRSIDLDCKTLRFAKFIAFILQSLPFRDVLLIFNIMLRLGAAFTVLPFLFYFCFSFFTNIGNFIETKVLQSVARHNNLLKARIEFEWELNRRNHDNFQSLFLTSLMSCNDLVRSTFWSIFMRSLVSVPVLFYCIP